MLFEVHVVDQEAYDAHLRTWDAGNLGAPRGGEHSETVDGLDNEEESAE